MLDDDIAIRGSAARAVAALTILKIVLRIAKRW
jgi:hypothetical protein